VRFKYLIVLIPILMTLAVYWRTGSFDFVNFDDNFYVVGNAHVRAGLTLDGIRWAFTSFHAANWHPLTWLSHMLDCQLSGMSPGRHHLTSVLLHLANTALLFLVLARMTGTFWRSVFVASLFALHPMHVESVAWVAERKDVLSTLFFLLTLWCYSRYAERPGLQRYGATLCAFALGLLAKPMLVTVPFVLLLLDYWPLRRWGAAGAGKDDASGEAGLHPATPAATVPLVRLVMEKVPFVVLSILSCLITVYAQKAGGAVVSVDKISLLDRVAGSLAAYGWYLCKMVWPNGLAFYYPLLAQLPLWQVAAAVALIGGVSAAVFLRGRQSPFLAVGWLWFLGTLVPVIGLVKVGMQATADRYTYIPYIGLFIMVAWYAPELLQRTRCPRPVLWLAATVPILAFSICSWIQVGSWSDSQTLTEHALSVTSDNFMAHSALGDNLDDRGHPDEAITHYREALRINPSYEIAHNSLGIVLVKQGKLSEAASHFSTALQLNPGYAAASMNMGVCLASQGKFEEAVNFYHTAQRINPENPDIAYNLGLALNELSKSKGSNH